MIKNLSSSNYPLLQNIDYSVQAAKKYITLFYQVATPNEEQQSMLAAAHYTLALQQDIPVSHCKMHTNAAITLLQNLPHRNHDLDSMMANAYFKRAELFEQENAFQAAGLDYQRTLMVFKQDIIKELSDEDKLILAQSAISIADLILNEEVDASQYKNTHPLFYVNKSLEFLSCLPKTEDETWTTLAYAHQVAGLSLSHIDIEDAKEAFRTAIAMTFKTEPKVACRMLGDIYNSLGLLYEQQFNQCPIQNMPRNVQDHAILYFILGLIFNPGENGYSLQEDPPLLDTLFETIYRILDPFLSPLSSAVTRDFIDALIFIYHCVTDDILPNQTLGQQLAEPETFNTFAQHIYWLVEENFYREHAESGLLKAIQPCDYDLFLDLSETLSSLLNHDSPKIHYLNAKLEF